MTRTGTEPLLSTGFPGVKLFKRGKVRDVYDLEGTLLIVSTDRISCFDVVLPDGIPRKGEVLTRLSVFWFGFMKEVARSHFVTADVREFPGMLAKYADVLKRRSMIVRKADAIPVECVVRGYLSGSGWKEYVKTQSVCGVRLPEGLKESDRLPETIFTPATKEEAGHDVNVTEEHVARTVGKETVARLKQVSTRLYEKAAAYAEGRGIIIADTKFEFGVCDGDLMLIDEVLTPDSSRFWPKDGYRPGGPQMSFDKQFVRDYLESLEWDKTPPAPELPGEIIAKTSQKYLQALTMLTGESLAG